MSYTQNRRTSIATPPRLPRGVYGPTPYTAFDAPEGTRCVYAIDSSGKVCHWINFPETEDPAPHFATLLGYLSLTGA